MTASEEGAPSTPMRLLVYVGEAPDPVEVVGSSGWIVRSFDWWTYNCDSGDLWVVSGTGTDGSPVRFSARCSAVRCAYLSPVQ